jgi:hypothetical protein
MATNTNIEINNDVNKEDKSDLEIPWSYMEKFFVLLKKQDEKNILVQCKLCNPRVHTLSTSITSTGNLRKHIQV